MKRLLGKIPTKVEPGIASDGSDNIGIKFTMEDGSHFVLIHVQDCCEDVQIEDVDGDLNDLVGLPITTSSERSENDSNACESGTWTFFHIGNRKHVLVIRFYGASNGYYSETATLFPCNSEFEIW